MRTRKVQGERGYFGIGIWHSKAAVNVGTLWRTAHIYGAQFIFTVGRRYTRQPSDVLNSPLHVPLMHFTDLDGLRNYLPRYCRLVGVEMDERAGCITQFRHPPQACYLLGAEDHGLNEASRAACETLVQLPGSMSLNVATAGSIVIFDRWAKAQDRGAAVGAA